MDIDSFKFNGKSLPQEKLPSASRIILFRFHYHCNIFVSFHHGGDKVRFGFNGTYTIGFIGNNIMDCHFER